MNKIFQIFLLVILVAPVAYTNSDSFDQANELYENKEYTQAIKLYHSVEQTNLESASLYFNLGNAYFKTGDLGHAVLYYMKAKRLDPTDEDIIQNLEFAQKFSSVQMEGVELNPISAFLSSIVNNYKLSLLAWLSSFFFILFFIAMIMRYALVQNKPVVRMFVVFSLVLLMLSAGLTTFKYRTDYLTKRGVIVASESKVYTGASMQSDVELDGAPGLVVQILSESSDFYQVLFENKRRGWIQKDLVAEI